MLRRKFLKGAAGFGAISALGGNPSHGAEGSAAPTRSIPEIAGPDKNTKTPAFRMPAGAIDTHCHIFGPAAEYPFSPTRPYTPPEAPLSMFRALHEKIGVERAVIVNATMHGFDNRVVTDAIARSDGKYRGVANINGAMSDADLLSLNKAGMRGCRFAFLKRLGGVGDMNAFKRLVDRAAGIGWHVDVYLEPGSIREFTPILTAMPTTYVIDHMGTIDAAKGLGTAALHQSVVEGAVGPGDDRHGARRGAWNLQARLRHSDAAFRRPPAMGHRRTLPVNCSTTWPGSRSWPFHTRAERLHSRRCWPEIYP